MSKATIVIPNINGKGWLKDSIESIYAQTEQDFDLIVVDNGSTDESLEQARSYCTRPNFTLIENGRNTGFSYAVNQGIARAQSKYVVLFNNDAFAEPQWLAELLRTADADPKIFAVQSLMIRHFERELADDAGDYVTWMGFACKTGDGRRVSRYTKQKRIFSACGGAALYRKSILDEIGGFDENFFAYFEDVDLSWRANNAGYKNVLCPAAKCYHICGASTGAVKYNAFKSQQSGRNSILLPLKNEPLLMLVLNFIPLALGYLLKCYKFHKQGFGKAWDKGMHEAFALLKAGKLTLQKPGALGLPQGISVPQQQLTACLCAFQHGSQRIAAGLVCILQNVCKRLSVHWCFSPSVIAPQALPYQTVFRPVLPASFASPPAAYAMQARTLPRSHAAAESAARAPVGHGIAFPTP